MRRAARDAGVVLQIGFVRPLPAGVRRGAAADRKGGGDRRADDPRVADARAGAAAGVGHALERSNGMLAEVNSRRLRLVRWLGAPRSKRVYARLRTSRRGAQRRGAGLYETPSSRSGLASGALATIDGNLPAETSATTTRVEVLGARACSSSATRARLGAARGAHAGHRRGGRRTRAAGALEWGEPRGAARKLLKAARTRAEPGARARTGARPAAVGPRTAPGRRAPDARRRRGGRLMRALAYRGPHALELEERPQPHACEGEVVVRVDACSICGTDLRIAAKAPTGRSPTLRAHPRARDRGDGGRAGAAVAVEEGARVSSRRTTGAAAAVPACGRRQPGRRRARRRHQPRTAAPPSTCCVPHELVEQEPGCRAERRRPGRRRARQSARLALRGSRACQIGTGDVVIVRRGPIGLFHVAARAGSALAGRGCSSPSRTPSGGARARLRRDRRRRRRVEPQRARTPSSSPPRSRRPAAGSRAAGPAAGSTSSPACRATARGRARHGPRALQGARRHRHDGRARNRVRDALELILDGGVDAGSLIDARSELDAAAEAFDLAGSGRALKVVIET